jgi:branched-chain amino acid transport system ATP-binding protein
MTLLSAHRIVAGYQPDLPILNGVTLHVAQQEIVTIIGPNGAGKSTLLKAIAGLVTISSGEVSYRDRNMTHQAAHRLVTSGIAYVPQTANIFTTLSIQQNLAVAAHTLGRQKRERIEYVYQLFPLLAERRHDKGRVLSGGQRQLLALALALITAPGLIMLDEPSAGLAPKVVDEVFGHIRALVDNGVSVLLVEQNARAALALSDRGYVLAEGRNQLDGPAQDLLNDPMVAEIYLGTRRTVQ